MGEWRRARSSSQKEVRREEIQLAARRLFATHSYAEVSLNGIAREAGMSKPNVYRYYSSREEIFLQILGEEQLAFSQRITAELKGLKEPVKPDRIVEAWVNAALESPDFMALLPQLGTSLEMNSSLKQLTAYKKATFAAGRELVELHVELYSELSAPGWSEVINCSVSLMAGLWPLCSGNGLVHQAMRDAEVGQDPWDFRLMMNFGMTALILGAAKSARVPRPTPS